MKKAVERLENRIGIDPRSIVAADVESIKESIQVAGLYNAKSVRIKEIAKIVMEKYNGNLRKILDLPLEDARKELLSLPGIGFKTADVILLFAANKSVFPVDTHIMRISKRLGVIKEKFYYENVRHAWEKALPCEKYAIAHILLIIHGRRVCKSGKPLCNRCPITSFCAFYEKSKRGVIDESSKKENSH
ncbi:MAG: endonuclease III domain-containing protein, partial [Candidatus Heimdallarchaeaceae archaeon]